MKAATAGSASVANWIAIPPVEEIPISVSHLQNVSISGYITCHHNSSYATC
jgi:hypothetical protein